MAGRIEVDPWAVAARGQLMVVAAGAVDRLEVAAHLPRIAGALPGSRSALAVERLVTVWTEAEDAWARAARRHGHALMTGAGDYDGTESQVRRMLGDRGSDRPTPGPLQRRGVL